jgi:hypothetical protein
MSTTINQTSEPAGREVQEELYDLLKVRLFDMKTITQGYFNPLIGGIERSLEERSLQYRRNRGLQRTTSSGETYVPSDPERCRNPTWSSTKMNTSSLVFR